jgi:Flp pilus assembly protein TadG
MKINIFRFGQLSTLRSGEEGSALVELALSLPMLCLMLLGATEFARIAYAAIEVTNAAHSAAVYAASSSAAAGDSTGITNAAIGDSPNLAGSNAVSVVTPLGFSCSCSNTAYTPTSCSDNNTCVSHNAAMITTVTVQTQTTFSPMITLPGFSPTVTLKGSSSQVVSNE